MLATRVPCNSAYTAMGGPLSHCAEACVAPLRIYLIAVLVLLVSCGHRAAYPGLHFTSLPASETGISFNNSITETDSLNMFVNEYTYMGAGVGIGDFNNDGLPDVFFCGNQVSASLNSIKAISGLKTLPQRPG